MSRPLLAAGRLLSPSAASAQDPFLFPFTTKETRGGGGKRACLSLGSYRRVCNSPAGLVWVGFLLSDSHVFSADFFLRCSPLSPPPLSL